MESMSAFKALAITRRQKRSSAPCVCLLRASQAPRLSVGSPGTGRMRPRKARPRASLSRRVKARAARKRGRPCSGAGSHEGPSVERRPPGSIRVISLLQRIAVRNPDAPVEAGEVGAAAEEHVLAVVDDLAQARMEVRRGAPAQVAAPLDELHAQAGFGQRAGRAHAGNAAADHGDGPALARSVYIAHFL